MRNFKLYVYNKKYQRLLTDFNNNFNKMNLDPCGTFDENLSEGENDQFNLSFSMAGFVFNNGATIRNFWLDIVKIGSKLLLELNNGTKEIKMIISKITPNISQDNIIYNFEAQDEVSYLWSKRNLGYSYSNIDRGVENIYTIVNNVLEDNWLSSEWKVIDTEPDNLIDTLRSKPITLEVLDSNPYNVIIEACNTLNCFIRIDYYNQQISFYQKNQIPFSGYRYRPEVNLQSLTVDYDGSNFSTMLHVVGGENEYGEIITLVPSLPIAIQTTLLQEFVVDGVITWPEQLWNNSILLDNIPNYYTTKPNTEERKKEEQEIKDFLQIANQVPHLGQFLLDLDYFSKSKLLTSSAKMELDNIFNIKMRNNNIYLKIYTPIKYRTEWMIQQVLNEIKGFGEEYQAECQYIQQRASEGDDTTKFTTTEEAKQNISIINEKIVNACMNRNYELFRNMMQLYGEDSNIKPDFEDFPDIQNWLNTRQYYIDKVTSTINQIEVINEQLQSYMTSDGVPQDPNNPTYIELSSQLALLEKNKIAYETLGPGWDIEIWGQTYHIDGLYDYIIDVLKEQYDYAWDNQILSNITNINNIIEYYENENDKLWLQIYSNYGDFIYEAKYENTDELDSVSLFNQGITYFQQQKRPIANYSITVLDIAALECIGIPNLTIGSKIRVYNQLLNLKDVEYINNEPVQAEDNISYSNNELIVTELSYELRNPEKISISVQQVDNYQTIIEKLLLSIKK